jgi:hypothetical protein
MNFNPQTLSKILKNSILNDSSNIKPDRFNWKEYSIKEAKTWIMEINLKKE